MILSSVAFLSYGQQNAYIGPRLEYGSFFRSYSAGREALRSPSVGSVINWGGQIQYRIFDAITLEGGATIKRYQWKMRDKNFEERHPGFRVKAKSVATFPSVFGSFQYAHQIEKNTYFYAQLGIDYDFVNAKRLNASKSFARGNDDVTIASTFANRNLNAVPEIGIQWRDFYDGMWSVGLAFHASQSIGNLQEIDYQIINKGTNVIKDKAVMKGSYIGLNLKYNFMFFEKQKREKPTKKLIDQIVMDSVDVFEELPDTNVVTKDKVNDRDIVTKYKIKVKSPELTIYVYDHQLVDGDIISLFLNSDVILKEYTLTKDRYEIKVTIPEGSSRLILYAHNLGKYRPNTAAVVVYDGVKEQKIVMKSDLEESGTLEIKYNPK